MKAIAKRIALSPNKALGAQSIGMALLGMRGMSSDAREVQQVLHALTPRLKVSTLDRQACANILYSMSNMSSGRNDIRHFLFALAPKIAACVQENPGGLLLKRSVIAFMGYKIWIANT